MNSSTATLTFNTSSEIELRAEIARLRLQNRRLQDTADRMTSEMDAAALLQRQLTGPASLQLSGANIDVYCRPVGEVSGDMYDVVCLDEATTAIIVIDVAGHGLAAGMLAVQLKQRVRDYLDDSHQPDELDPGDLLSQLNGWLITAEWPDCQFATATVAIFDESSGVLRFARGGAPYPVLLQAVEAAATPLESEGALIGVIPHARFETIQVALSPGDAVCFWTDGLELLLDERELGALFQQASCAGRASDGHARIQLFDAVARRAESAVKLGRELDDTTMVVLERIGTKASQQPPPVPKPQRQILPCLS